MPLALQLPADPAAQAQPVNAPSFDGQYAKARALANQGQPEMALAAYNALLARSPGNVDVLLGRGIVYARLGRWAEAEADLGAAAAASPAYADVWEALANTYRWSDQPARAAEAWTRLAALRPKDPAPLLARARALRALGRRGEARADLERARKLGADAGAVDALLASLQPRGTSPYAAVPDAVNASGHTWAAGLSSSWTDPGRGPRWNDQTFSLRRYYKMSGKRGSLAFETLRAHRFGDHDYAWALDAYTDLWHGAYANLRWQKSATARLFPANSGRVEVYQSLGKGWEASLSDDLLGFDARVNIYGVGLAKYAGNFYVQLRHQNIVSRGSHSTGERLLARWYYAGDGDNYLELSANRGSSDDPLSLVGGRIRSGGGGANWVHYFTPEWGARAGAWFARAAGGARERGMSFSLYRRW